MKKIGSFLLAGLCLLAAACSDDDDAAQPLQISSADTGFEADGGEGGIGVAAPGGVEAVADKDWIEITSVTADSVRFRVGPNPEALLRTGKITVSSSGGREEVTILQKGSTFGISGDSVVIKGMGGERFAVAVKYTMSGVASFEVEGKPDWLTITPVNDSIVFTATQNFEEKRTAELTFVAGWKSVKFKVLQNAVRWLADMSGNGIEEILLTADKGSMYDAFLPTEDLQDYDPAYKVTVAAGCDWLTIEEDPWGNNNMLVYTANETGKARATALEVTAQGKTLTTVPVCQLPVDRNGSFFRGTWKIHSTTLDPETGSMLPQESSITISPVSAFTPAVLNIIGLDQMFGEQDPAEADLKTGADGIPYVQLMCQFTGAVLTANTGQTYGVWLVPMSEEGSLVANEDCGWNIEYDRETDNLVVVPNDKIVTDLPAANEGLQFPGIGVLGRPCSYVQGQKPQWQQGQWGNFGQGFYFPDPSRGVIWLEKVAE